MPTGLFWIAYSEQERQQALDVARALQQRESRDELGLGSVRDGIADLLFPGTSTLQTRAKYFLLVPWAYEQARGPSAPADLRRNVRHAEERLIHSLMANCPDDFGLIGRFSQGGLQRMPSSLYWQGLQVWGVRRVRGPQAAVERAICRSGKSVLRDDDGDLVGTPAGVWHPGLPPVPHEHPESATLDLTFDQADFLMQLLSTEDRTVGTMLGLLTADPAEHDQVERAWTHPSLGGLPVALRDAVEQARRFSLTMNGAAWLYNVILSELDGRTELAAEHRERYEAWTRDVTADQRALAGWELPHLWEVASQRNPRIPLRTRLFVERWVQLVSTNGPAALLDNRDARNLIIEREQRMKGANARTRNERALKQWSGNSGTAPLDFRWGVARNLISDIRRGLEAGVAAD